MTVELQSDRIEPEFETLEDERDWLVEQVQGIDAQLSQKDRRDPETGARIGEHEYHEWRGRAVGARRHLLARLREVKAALREQHQSQFEDDRTRLVRIEEKLDRLLALAPKPAPPEQVWHMPGPTD